MVTFAYRVQILSFSAAEKEGLLETFILSYIETGGNINKVLNNTPENAGDKPKHKTWQKQHQ